MFACVNYKNAMRFEFPPTPLRKCELYLGHFQKREGGRATGSPYSGMAKPRDKIPPKAFPIKTPLHPHLTKHRFPMYVIYQFPKADGGGPAAAAVKAEKRRRKPSRESNTSSTRGLNKSAISPLLARRSAKTRLKQ